jgi:hypothetical protein
MKFLFLFIFMEKFQVSVTVMKTFIVIYLFSETVFYFIFK